MPWTRGSGTSAPPAPAQVLGDCFWFRGICTTANAQVLVALYGNMAQAYLYQLYLLRHLKHSRDTWLWDTCTTCTR
jgi:hypothetical protein